MLIVTFVTHSVFILHKRKYKERVRIYTELCKRFLLSDIVSERKKSLIQKLQNYAIKLTWES
jgi:hypothetical protein